LPKRTKSDEKAPGADSGDRAESPEQEEYSEEELELGDDVPSGSGDIPVRVLSGFCIFDRQPQERRMVSALELLGLTPQSSFTASGFVKAKAHMPDSTSDDDDEEDPPEGYGQFVRGLEVVEFDIHHVSDGDIDPYACLRVQGSLNIDWR
jgi:hypothetical protein